VRLHYVDKGRGAMIVPVLVNFSDKDFAFKIADGERIAGMVPNGRFQVIRNAGHFLQEDAGEEIAANIIDFPNRKVWNPSNAGTAATNG